MIAASGGYNQPLMPGRTVFLYHPLYDGRGFSPLPESWKRYQLTRKMAGDLSMFEHGLLQREPQAAGRDLLLMVHKPDYLAFLERRDREGSGFMDYGDTPAWTGLFQRTCVSVGASQMAVELIMTGQAEHAFNPSGGLHHAFPDRAAGFCILNDVALTARRLQRDFGLERIAILDIDGHHGDGTQAIFWEEPVLTISLHRYDGRFFPGTGHDGETGEGQGRGYAINVPLPRWTGDADWLYALEEVAFPALRAYQPEFLIVEFGVDGHYRDPLVGLSLTTRGYQEAARRIHELAHELCQGRLVVLGGGGYSPHDAARSWLVGLNAFAQVVPASALGPLHDAAEPPRADGAAREELEDVIRRLRANPARVG